jgi:hypothetical protein
VLNPFFSGHWQRVFVISAKRGTQVGPPTDGHCKDLPIDLCDILKEADITSIRELMGCNYLCA